MISRAPKIRRVAILAIFYAWMPIPCYPVYPEISRIERHYVDWHSLFRYLSDHSVSMHPMNQLLILKNMDVTGALG